MTTMHGTSLDPAEFNQSYYSTEGYDDYLERFREEARLVVVDPLLALLHPEKGTTFLDVGCGMGGNVLELRDAGFDAFGVEISPYCLEHSPASAWMTKGDALHIPYPDASFDIVICKDVFPYLTKEEVPLGIQELVRVARKIVVFATIDHDSPNACQTYNPDPLRSSSVQHFTNEAYIELFADAGADLLHTDLFDQPNDSSFVFAIR